MNLLIDVQKGAKVLANAIARVGEGEVPPGSNRGPLPDKCYRFVHDGADPAEASVDEREWCAELVCLDVHDAGLVGPKTASTGGIHDWALQHNRVIFDPRHGIGSAADIIPGDAGLMLGDTVTGFFHSAMARGKAAGGVVPTVEGNEMDRVMKRSREVNAAVWVRPWL